MTTRNSSTSTVLIACILLLTFPLWLGLGLGFFGLVIGLCGAAFGIVAGVLGAIFGILMLPFKFLFGWHGGFPHFHFSSVLLVTVVILVVLLVRKK